MFEKNQSTDIASTPPAGPTSEEMNTAISYFQAESFGQAELFLIDLVHKYPNDPFAWKGVSVVLYQQGKIFEALKPMQELVRIAPEDGEAQSNLGSLLNELGRKEEAEGYLRCAVELSPYFAEGHFNLGNLLKDLGRLHEARECYREALQIKPNFIEARCNLGVILKMLLQAEESESVLRQVVADAPSFAEAHFNLGNVLQDQGRFLEANKSYQEAIRIRSGAYPEALANMGVSQRALGNYGVAERIIREALALVPDQAELHSNLGVILNELGNSEEAEKSIREAIRLLPDIPTFRSNLLFLLSSSLDGSEESYLAEAKRFGQLVTNLARTRFDFDRKPDPSLNRLRVGFVSGDLRNHPVGYFVEGLARAIDKTRIELLAFPTNLLLDDLSERLMPSFSKWQPIYGLEDEIAAKMIHGMVDILVDLSGHTEHNRLPVFAYKPAPVQISWLGYWASTGVAEMDYLLGDPVVTPEGVEDRFSEKIWRFPVTRFCYTPPHEDIPIRDAPFQNNGHITFGSFNKLSKLTDEVVAVWSEILAHVPEAKLMLKSRQLEDPEIRLTTQARFSQHGIPPKRLILEGVTNRNDYLEAFNRIDIALDPFPFPGGTTSADAIWMGVPVLTRKGENLISRQGEGILTSAKLTEWIATDNENYVRKAVAFATDLERLVELKKELRKRDESRPLYDADQFARDFEVLVRSIWKDYCKEKGVAIADSPVLDFSKWT